MYSFIDIETDNLLRECTVVHCAVAFMEDSQQFNIYPSDTYPTMELWLESLSGYTLVAHNGINFDFPALKKLHNFTYDIDEVVDTLILSRVYFPDREGHSLEWWGSHLNFPKGNHSDWSKFSQEMLTYCKRDVEVLRRVFYTLEEEGKGWDWKEPVRLSKRFADIITRQELHGVLFNTVKAEELVGKLEQEVAEIEGKILASIPSKVVQSGATVNKPFLKTGGYTKQVESWINTL